MHTYAVAKTVLTAPWAQVKVRVFLITAVAPSMFRFEVSDFLITSAGTKTLLAVLGHSFKFKYWACLAMSAVTKTFLTDS